MYSLRYASSFLNEAKNASATALSCGLAVAEKDDKVQYVAQKEEGIREDITEALWGSKVSPSTISEDGIEETLTYCDFPASTGRASAQTM